MDKITIKLREYRKNIAGISQKDMAHKLDVSAVHLSRIENGRRDPKISLLRKYSECMGLSLEMFIFSGIDESYIHPNKVPAYSQLKSTLETIMENIT